MPGRRFSFELRSRYSTLFDRIDQTSVLGGFRVGQHAASLSWVQQKDAELGETRSHQARLGTNITLVRNRLWMQNQVNYNFDDGFMQLQRHILQYSSQCWGLRLEFLERGFRSGEESGREIRLAVSLKNIGTFFDMGYGGGNRF